MILQEKNIIHSWSKIYESIQWLHYAKTNTAVRYAIWIGVFEDQNSLYLKKVLPIHFFLKFFILRFFTWEHILFLLIHTYSLPIFCRQPFSSRLCLANVLYVLDGTKKNQTSYNLHDTSFLSWRSQSAPAYTTCKLIEQSTCLSIT